MSVSSGKLSLVERIIGVLCLMCLLVLFAGRGPIDFNALTHDNFAIFTLMLFSFWIGHVWLLVVLVMSLIRKKRNWQWYELALVVALGVMIASVYRFNWL